MSFPEMFETARFQDALAAITGEGSIAIALDKTGRPAAVASGDPQ